LRYVKCEKCGWHSSFPIFRSCPKCGGPLNVVEDLTPFPHIVFFALISLFLFTFLLSIYFLSLSGPQKVHGAALIFISPAVLLYAFAYRIHRAERFFKG